MVPLGTQEASSAILGNCFGANKVALAERFYQIMTSFTIVSNLAMSTILILFRYNIVRYFT